MKNLSAEIDATTKKYHDLEVRIDQHKLFLDSFTTNLEFRDKIMDSLPNIQSIKREEIEKTFEQKEVVLTDMDKFEKRLKLFDNINNWTTGAVAITILILTIQIFKKK